jgi:drug/metabolite transporter (DMT)-like permease
MPPRRFQVSPVDGFLLLTATMWGINYSVMKRAFAEVPPMAFNALRFTCASAAFLFVIAVTRARTPAGSPRRSLVYTPTPLDRRDRRDLVWLAIVGHFLYQVCWASGLALTTASSGALIFAATPIVVGLLSAAIGHERIGRLYWAAAATSACGIYLVVGLGRTLGEGSIAGDGLIFLGLICWSVFTVGSRRLMSRHSPLFVTGVTMAIGTVPYGLVALPFVVRAPWRTADPVIWPLLAYAALGAGCLAYIGWFIGVQRLGSSRTAIYTNLIPIVALAVAAAWLGETVTPPKVIGTLLVVIGVLLTRFRTVQPDV